MRAVLILTSLWIGLAVAGACDREKPQMVGEKAEVTAFGESCLGFDLGGATEKPYRVTALSVPYGVGQTLMPVDDNRNPVNTFDQPVTLKAGKVTPAQVAYQAQDVAYLRIDHRVDVKDGVLRRNGQAVLTKSGMDYGNLLWGVLWTTTFGLVSLFWWPNTSVTQTYTEAIPLSPSAPAITFEYGGGGGCAALSGFEGRFVIDPGRMRPGKVYHLKTHVYCFGGSGVRGSALGVVDPVTLRYSPEGYPSNPDGSINAWVWLDNEGSPFPGTTLTVDVAPLPDGAPWPADASFAMGRSWTGRACLEYGIREDGVRYCAKEVPVVRTATDTPQNPVPVALNPHLEGSVAYGEVVEGDRRLTRLEVTPSPRPGERAITDRFELSGRVNILLTLEGYTRAENLTAGRTYEFSNAGDHPVLPGRYRFTHLCGVRMEPVLEEVFVDGSSLSACFLAGRE
jgi:hypothetical protein